MTRLLVWRRAGFQPPRINRRVSDGGEERAASAVGNRRSNKLIFGWAYPEDTVYTSGVTPGTAISTAGASPHA